MDDLRTPTFDMIVEMHDVVLTVTPGREGLHVVNDVHRAAERPLTYINFRLDWDINTVCAVLIDSIARYHGFNDGNKRTALMTALFTYRINNIHFRPTMTMNRQFDALVMWVVKKKPEIEDIEARLRKLRNRFESESEPTPARLFISFINMRRTKEAKKNKTKKSIQ